MSFGNKIKELRVKNSLNQESFANRIGVSRRTVIDWEKDRFDPNMGNLKAICDEFDIDISYFIGQEVNTMEEKSIEPIESEVIIDPNSDILKNIYIDENSNYKYYRKKFISESHYKYFNCYKNIRQLILSTILSFLFIIILLIMLISKFYILILLLISLVYIIIKYVLYIIDCRGVEIIINQTKFYNKLYPTHNLLNPIFPIHAEIGERIKIYMAGQLIIDMNKNSIKGIMVMCNNYKVTLPYQFPLNSICYAVKMTIYTKYSKAVILDFNTILNKKRSKMQNHIITYAILDLFNKFYFQIK